MISGYSQSESTQGTLICLRYKIAISVYTFLCKHVKSPRTAPNFTRQDFCGYIWTLYILLYIMYGHYTYYYILHMDTIYYIWTLASFLGWLVGALGSPLTPTTLLFV